MRLFNRRQRRTTAFGDQLDQVETVRTAQQRTDLAILELDDNVGEQGWQAIERTCTQVSSFQRVRRIRIRRSQLREVLPLLYALIDLFCLGFERLDLLRTRGFRRTEENVRDFVLFPCVPALQVTAQIIIYLAFGNDDLVIHLTLAHARDGHFLANILAELDEGDAILLQRIAELGERHLVIGGDTLQRLLKL